MIITEKISVAMGRDELRRAKSAAKLAGVSLSAYVTSAVRARLEEQQRADAAREVLATFEASELPTPEEQHALVALWSQPRASSKGSGKGVSKGESGGKGEQAGARTGRARRGLGA